MRIAKPACTFAVFVAALFALFTQGCKLTEGDGNGDPNAPVFHGYFTVSFPTFYSRLNLDSIYQVLWSPSDSVADDEVNIALYRDGKFLAPLTSATLNNGNYSWSLPFTRSNSGYKVGSGSSYRLKFTSVSDTSKWDFSQAFSIYSRYTGILSMTAPAANAEAKIDSSLAIRWQATGDIGSSVGIQLYKDTVLVATVASYAANSGYYQWSRVTTPLGSGNDYHIRVFSAYDPSIASVSPAFRISSGYLGGFEVTFPRAGDTIVAGQYSKVTWKVAGNPGSSFSVMLYRDSTLVSYISYEVSGDSVTLYGNAGLATSSRYRIKIVSVSDPGIFSYSGFFTVKGTDPDDYENDDSLKLAKPIATNGQPQQRTLTYLDQDWIRVNAAAGKRYLLGFRSNTSLSATLYDSTGSSLSGSQSGTQFQVFLNPTYVGPYYVRVTGGSSAYTLAANEYDSTQSSFAVSFTSPDAKTTWAAGSSYTINWSPDTLFYGALVTLALYNDTVFTQSIGSYLSNSGSYSWSIPSGIYTSSKYRIRIVSYYNSQVYAYSPYFTISGATPDSYESDNSKSDAKVLAAGGAAQARNLTSGDVDWIRIDAVKGKSYLASFKSDYSQYAYLQDSNGTQVSYQYGTQFSVSLAPTYTGAYYLRVVPSSGYGNYTVSLISYDASQDGLPVKFTAPDSAATWASGSYYTITWSPDVSLFGSYVNLALYLDSGLVQSITSSASNSGSYSWSVPAGLVSSNRYHIRISNYSSATIYGYGPRFTISGITPDAYEPDNVKGDAKDIATNGAVQQRNVTTADSDWVKFTGVAGKSYLVNVSSAATSLYLYVQDSAGASVGYQSGTKFSLVVTPARTGTYYARVQPSYSTGAYSLSVIAYDAGSAGLPAKFIAPDSSTTWAAGSSYSVTWTPDTLLFGNYVSLSLYQDTVFLQSLATSVSNTTAGYSVSVPGGLASGRNYRVRLTNYNNSEIYGSSRPFTISGQAPDSLEPNDSAAAARAVKPNTGKAPLTLSYRDKDWFRFDAKANMLYLIQATSGSSLYTTERLWSELGKTQLLIGNKTSSIDSVNGLAWVCPADGIYSVSVEPYSSYSTSYGPYGFEIKEIDPASYKFGVTAPVAGTTAHNSQSLGIAWTDPSNVRGYVDLFLYDGSGVVQTIAANVTNNGSYTWTVPAALGAHDGYYIKVISRLSASISGNSGSFSVAP